MEVKKKSTNAIDGLLARYDISVRSLAKLLDLNPSTITHWKNARNKISPQNLEKISILDKKLEVMINQQKLSKREALESLLADKKNSFHANSYGIDQFKQIVDNKVLEYFETVENLKRENKFSIEDLSGFQFVFKDRDERLTVIGYAIDVISNKPIDLPFLGELLLMKNEVRKKVADDFRLIIIASEYTGKFIKAASEIPKLELKTFDMVMKQI